MKNVTSDFKEQIKKLGKEITVNVTYENDTLTSADINRVDLSYDGAILKSVMKKLEIDSNVDISIDTWVNFQFGVKVGNTYEYIDYGSFKVINSEKQEDTNSYKLTCYDRIIEFMKDYNQSTLTFPMTVREFLSSICQELNVQYKSSDFANYDKQLTYNPFLDAEGNDLGYTYRDILDQIAEVSGGTICVNDEDKIEVRYITNTSGKNKIKTSESEWEPGTINQNTGANKDDNTRLRPKGYFPIKPGTYYLSMQSTDYAWINIIYYDENYDFVIAQGSISSVNGVREKRIEIPSGVAYFRPTLRYKSNGVVLTSSDILTVQPQLELGTTKTAFEEYKLDEINEKNLKDINVKFGEIYGPINSVVLSRAGESDNVYLRDETSVTTNGLCEIKIVDNQIMNDNNRSDYLQGILGKVNGITYSINDFKSTGICYLELCDRYNVIVGESTYPCIMFNDEIIIESGLEENINTEKPEQSETDYTKADKTDRKINQAYSIVDKQNLTITNLVSQTTQSQQLNDQRILELQERTNSVIQTLTTTNATIEVMQSDIISGQETLHNNLVTIDINGISVSTNSSAIQTLMTNEKFVIKSGNQTLAFFGYDTDTNSTKAEMDNLTVTNYFIAGVHRVETYEENYEDRTGWFYIG